MNLINIKNIESETSILNLINNCQELNVSIKGMKSNEKVMKNIESEIRNIVFISKIIEKLQINILTKKITVGIRFKLSPSNFYCDL